MAGARRIPEHLVKLLASSIETEDRLDILLFLRANAGQKFAAKALAAAFRGRNVDAAQHLAILCGRGFLGVSIGVDLLYGYAPLSPAVVAALDEIAELNRDHRADVVATLHDRAERDPAHAFANAFLVRKTDKKEGS